MKVLSSIGLPVALFLTVGSAPAATTAAWTALDQAADQACKVAIVAAHPAPPPGPMVRAGRILRIGGPTGDDFYGLTILWPTATSAEAWLCLYDKHKAKVHVAMIEPQQP